MNLLGTLNKLIAPTTQPARGPSAVDQPEVNPPSAVFENASEEKDKFKKMREVDLV